MPNIWSRNCVLPVENLRTLAGKKCVQLSTVCGNLRTLFTRLGTTMIHFGQFFSSYITDLSTMELIPISPVNLGVIPTIHSTYHYHHELNKKGY